MAVAVVSLTALGMRSTAAEHSALWSADSCGCDGGEASVCRMLLCFRFGPELKRLTHLREGRAKGVICHPRVRIYQGLFPAGYMLHK